MVSFFDVTNRLEGTSSARFSARKLIYGAFISTFLSPLHERGCSEAMLRLSEAVLRLNDAHYSRPAPRAPNIGLF